MTYTADTSLPAATASIVAKRPGLVDPFTVDAPAEPAFPLTQNNLQDLVEYSRAFGSQISVVSKVNLPAGSHFCDVFTHVSAPVSTWSSIQTGKTSHEEIPCALVYTNHSCAPSLELEVFAPDASGEYPNGISGKFRVVGNRPLKVGDELTWFYPSTEFISPRPFECLCGADKDICIGVQRGSYFLSEAERNRHFINKHISALLADLGRRSG